MRWEVSAIGEGGRQVNDGWPAAERSEAPARRHLGHRSAMAQPPVAFWVQEPDAMRETMKSCKGLLEELNEKYPDEPQKVLDTLLDLLLNAANKAQESAADDV